MSGFEEIREEAVVTAEIEHGREGPPDIGEAVGPAPRPPPETGNHGRRARRRRGRGGRARRAGRKSRIPGSWAGYATESANLSLHRRRASTRAERTMRVHARRAHDARPCGASRIFTTETQSSPRRNG